MRNALSLKPKREKNHPKWDFKMNKKAIFLFLLVLKISRAKVNAESDLNVNQQRKISESQKEEINKAINISLFTYLLLGVVLLLGALAFSLIFQQGWKESPHKILTWVWLFFDIISIMLTIFFLGHSIGMVQDKFLLKQSYSLESLEGNIKIETYPIKIGTASWGTMGTSLRGKTYWIGQKQYGVFQKNLLEKEGIKSGTKIRVYYLTLHCSSLHPFWSFEKSPMIINYEKAE